jgi:hypothetical protein
MASMPLGLCVDSADHRSMLSLSVLSLLANIAPYMTLVGFATGLHRCTFADNGIAVNFLQNFLVLFFRYKPAYFYWSSLSFGRRVLSACSRWSVPLWPFRTS